MSKRRDRERFQAMKAADPGYKGFRGYGQDMRETDQPSLIALTCSECGRRRNIDPESAPPEGEPFICLSCQEEREAEGEPAQEEALTS